jgi:hypothetical protein
MSRCISRPFIPTTRCSIIRDPASTLTRARAIALENGVRYAYTGNVHDEDGESTYCHACGQKLIGRNWYRLSDWNLTADGRCNRCGTPAPASSSPRRASGAIGASRFVCAISPPEPRPAGWTVDRKDGAHVEFATRGSDRPAIGSPCRSSGHDDQDHGLHPSRRLHDLIGRWMLDRLEPSDPTDCCSWSTSTRCMSPVTSRCLPRVCCRASTAAGSRSRTCSPRAISRISSSPICPAERGSERASRLVADYRADPGLFYRETPFGARSISPIRDNADLCRLDRIKRIRRLAEKSARKVVDWLCEEIRRRLDPDPRNLGFLGRSARAPEWPHRISSIRYARAHGRALLQRLRAMQDRRLAR